MNTEIDMTKERVLLTFAGNTDPTRGQHDGPILHICRYYRPQKIYLILTKEMQERDENKNIYRESILKNIDNYDPELIRVYTGIENAHEFDGYFSYVYNTFKGIIEEIVEGTQILVNVTSGTPQMTANLISYIVDARNRNIIPIQVSTPENKSNFPPPFDYDTEEEAKKNKDSKEETRTNRLMSPDLTRYSRVSLKNQIERLLDQYEYATPLELLNQKNIYNKSLELKSLLMFGLDRKNLRGAEVNKTLARISDGKYEDLYYYPIDKKARVIPLWYELVDYFALALAKLNSGDISGYILMLEPIMVNLYLSILKDLDAFKIAFYEIFYDANKSSQNKGLEPRYKVKEEFRVSYSQLFGQVEGSMKNKRISSLDTNRDISDILLKSLIECMIKTYRKANGIESKDFSKLTQALEGVKEPRNQLAHSLKTYGKKDIGTKVKLNPKVINEEIINFLTKYYTPLGFKPSMLDIYDNINKEIKRILEEEK